MPSLTMIVSVSSNRLWALSRLSYSSLFSSNLDSVLCRTGARMFKTSLFLSPQVLAIVIRSHIFHMHLVTLLLKDKTTRYSIQWVKVLLTTMICGTNTTNSGMMKYLTVCLSYVWRVALTLFAVQLLLGPKSRPNVFMKSSLLSQPSVMLLSQQFIFLIAHGYTHRLLIVLGVSIFSIRLKVPFTCRLLMAWPISYISFVPL